MAEDVAHGCLAIVVVILVMFTIFLGAAIVLGLMWRGFRFAAGF